MDPLRFAVAAVPLAAYLAMIGLVGLRRRPLLVTGSGDLATLGVALTGLALAGPIALFRPEAATAELGDSIWLFLLAFYWLWVALVVMLCRPRLVVYNLSAAALRPLLSETARQLDAHARWAGDSLALPTLGVQLHFDESSGTRTTSLVSSGPEQDLVGWRRLAKALDRALRGVEAPPAPRGGLLLGVGLTLLVLSVYGLAADPEATAVAWRHATDF